MLQPDSQVTKRTRELCEAILAQPEYCLIQERILAFEEGCQIQEYVRRYLCKALEFGRMPERGEIEGRDPSWRVEMRHRGIWGELSNTPVPSQRPPPMTPSL